MASVLDTYGRLDRAFGADQQESRLRHPFEFTYSLYERELKTRAGVTIAMGDFYAKCNATWDDSADGWDVEVLGWFSNERLTHSISVEAANGCEISKAVVRRLQDLNLDDALQECAAELALEMGPW